MSDRTPAGQFLDAAIGLLRRLRDEEAGPIAAAGTMIADTVAGGGRLFAFGAGHSSLAAQDLVYRAGGIALMNLLTVPGSSASTSGRRRWGPRWSGWRGWRARCWTPPRCGRATSW